MDVYQILMQDHRTVEKIFVEIEATTDSEVERRELLFRKLRKVVEGHTVVEENILYPEIERYPATKELVAEAFDEHADFEETLQEISELPTDKNEWLERINELAQHASTSTSGSVREVPRNGASLPQSSGSLKTFRAQFDRRLKDEGTRGVTDTNSARLRSRCSSPVRIRRLRIPSAAAPRRSLCSSNGTLSRPLVGKEFAAFLLDIVRGLKRRTEHASPETTVFIEADEAQHPYSAD
jgi:hypothetical protein